MRLLHALAIPRQDLSSKVAAARNDGVEACVKALLDYPVDLGVQEQGCRALAALTAIEAQDGLAAPGAENQERAAVAGAIEARHHGPCP